jgi:arsenate reductase-like glutaredoxin family protein
LLHSADLARLKLLSLAIDDAIGREEMEEVTTLLNERERAIRDLSAMGIAIPAEEIENLLRQNEHLARRLRAAQNQLANVGRANLQVARAFRAYSN